MKNKVFRKNYYLVTVILLVFAMAIVACDPGEEDTGIEPGAETGDVLATEIGVEDFPEAESPETIDEDEDGDAFPPTEEPMAEPTATVEAMATEETEGIVDTDTIGAIEAVLASDLVGMDIINDSAEEVGEVSELLVSEDGTIQYALFDVGGFLGIADKTVAVSWDNFIIRHEDVVMMGEEADLLDELEEVVDIGQYKIIYTGLATDLENLPEFDTDVLNENGYFLDDVVSDVVDPDFDITPFVGQLQIGEFEDFNLLNMQDEDLGEVEDLIVDVSDGVVSYAVVDFGGFLGIAENSVAVPWGQLALEGETEIFRLNVDEPALASAPLFDFDTWDYPLAEGWDADYQTYWDDIEETVGMADTDAMAMSDLQVVLASDLVGMDITNDNAEEVGEVSELLLNQDGTIAYALFDVGGFLGIADKTVAVSWDNFEIRHEDELDVVDELQELVNIESYTIVYTGTAIDLENLPPFDNVILEEDGYVLDDLDTEAAADATDTDIDEFDVAPYVGQLQAGEFADFNLLNMQDEDLGEVEDLIIDVSDGEVSYAVVDFGGFLGIAENSVALPWDQLVLETDTETFRLDVDAPTLESAPAFDFDMWDYPLEEEWDIDYRTYWEAT